MLSWLVSTALRLRVVVLAASVLLLIVGFRSLRHAPMDVFPEFAPPYVEIQTEAPGLAPLQVEQLITRPIENALNGMPGVHSLRSTSAQGLAIISLVFDEGGDIFLHRRFKIETEFIGEDSEIPEDISYFFEEVGLV